MVGLKKRSYLQLICFADTWTGHRFENLDCGFFVVEFTRQLLGRG